jgi:hypothetical protein
MRAKPLSRFCGLLLIAAYVAASITAAASPVATCSSLDLDHPSHAGNEPGADKHHHGGKHSGSQAGDCLNCCIGICLLGASLPPPVSATASSALYGVRIVYPFEEIALADRSIPPDPAPPRPITRT